MNNFTLNVGSQLNILLVFFAGFASFFSGCVLPLLPLYIGYLFGDSKIDEAGNRIYDKKTSIINTLFFVLGISVIFYILGNASIVFTKFLTENNEIFQKIAGILIFILGLFQLGIIKIKSLNNNKTFVNKVHFNKMNPIKSFVLGLLFSFSWTPCVGVTLSAVLLTAASSQSKLYGNFLILMYTLGFIVPFIIVAIFTTAFFNMFKNKTKIINISTKIGGIIVVLIGILTFTGFTSWVSQLFLS